MSINIQEAFRTPNRLDQNRKSPQHIIIKMPNSLNKKRILNAVRGKKGKYLINADLSESHQTSHQRQ